MQTKSLDALSKQREARLALMNDKIMEQKYIETQDYLERLRIKEAELLEQQNVLNDSIAAYEAMHLHLEEQKKTQVSAYFPDFYIVLRRSSIPNTACCFVKRMCYVADVKTGDTRTTAR